MSSPVKVQDRAALLENIVQTAREYLSTEDAILFDNGDASAAEARQPELREQLDVLFAELDGGGVRC